MATAWRLVVVVVNFRVVELYLLWFTWPHELFQITPRGRFVETVPQNDADLSKLSPRQPRTRTE